MNPRELTSKVLEKNKPPGGLNRGFTVCNGGTVDFKRPLYYVEPI